MLRACRGSRSPARDMPCLRRFVLDLAGGRVPNNDDNALLSDAAKVYMYKLRKEAKCAPALPQFLQRNSLLGSRTWPPSHTGMQNAMVWTFHHIGIVPTTTMAPAGRSMLETCRMWPLATGVSHSSYQPWAGGTHAPPLLNSVQLTRHHCREHAGGAGGRSSKSRGCSRCGSSAWPQ